jgi:hypothetical protein
MQDRQARLGYVFGVAVAAVATQLVNTLKTVNWLKMPLVTLLCTHLSPKPIAPSALNAENTCATAASCHQNMHQARQCLLYMWILRGTVTPLLLVVAYWLPWLLDAVEAYTILQRSAWCCQCRHCCSTTVALVGAL